MPERGDTRPPQGLWTRTTRALVRLRWPVVALWILGAVALGGFAPTSQTAGTGQSSLLSEDSPAAAAEGRSYEHPASP